MNISSTQCNHSTIANATFLGQDVKDESNLHKKSSTGFPYHVNQVEEVNISRYSLHTNNLYLFDRKDAENTLQLA
jgi:hypothetical protein